MKNLILYVLLVSLTACTHNYVKAGITPQEDIKNKNFCYNYALKKALLITRYSSDAYIYARAKEDAKDECMSELGYRDIH